MYRYACCFNSYFGKSAREVAAIKRAKRAEIAWGKMEEMLDEEAKAFEEGYKKRYESPAETVDQPCQEDSTDTLMEQRISAIEDYMRNTPVWPV